MRNKGYEIATVENIRKGAKVKMALPRRWLELPTNKWKPIVWAKGTIIEIGKKSITVYAKITKRKRTTVHWRVLSQRMFCVADESGEFKSIYIKSEKFFNFD